MKLKICWLVILSSLSLTFGQDEDINIHDSVILLLQEKPPEGL